jgi:hypothetical protein
MQPHGNQFLCPQCGSPDFGRYCSHCSHSLTIDRHQFDLTLRSRLTRTGYEEVPRPGTPAAEPRSPVVSSLAGTLSNAATRCGAVLALDRSHVRQLEVLLLVEGDAHSDETVRSCVDALRTDLQASSAALLGRAGLPIKRVMVEVYLTYQGTDVRAALAGLGAGRSVTSPGKPKVSIRYVGIDLSAGDFYPKWRAALDPEKRLGQFHLEQTLEKEQQRRSGMGLLLHEVIGKPTQNLQELAWVAVSILTRPMYYASAIQEERITLATALRYLGLLTIFIAMVDGAVGMSGPASDHVPILSEVLLFLFLLGIHALGALVCWVGLRAVGGTGSYKKTLIAAITLSVVVVPIASMINACAFAADPAAYELMDIKPGDRVVGTMDITYAVPLLSVIHGIGRRRVFLGTLLPYAVIVVVALSIAVLIGIA